MSFIEEVSIHTTFGTRNTFNTYIVFTSNKCQDPMGQKFGDWIVTIDSLSVLIVYLR